METHSSQGLLRTFLTNGKRSTQQPMVILDGSFPMLWEHVLGLLVMLTILLGGLFKNVMVTFDLSGAESQLRHQCPGFCTETLCDVTFQRFNQNACHGCHKSTKYLVPQKVSQQLSNISLPQGQSHSEPQVSPKQHVCHCPMILCELQNIQIQ